MNFREEPEMEHLSIENLKTINAWLNTRYMKVILTVAHLDHDPTNNEDWNLKALCQLCHNRHDRKHRNLTMHLNKYRQQHKLFPQYEQQIFSKLQ
ncbi:HNH endonuclease family protein [Rufibacter immobilis]|nr:hypothetical protein [Rufibacter immobilis]